MRQQGAAVGVQYPSPLDNTDMSTAVHVKQRVDELIQSMSGALVAGVVDGADGAGGACIQVRESRAIGRG